MGKAEIKNKTVIKWDGREELQYQPLYCCCFTEISGIQDINDAFTTLCVLARDDIKDEGLASVVLFTTAGKHLAGDNLMAEIHRRKLGTVTFDDAVKNRDGSSEVWLYKWVLNDRNWVAFRNWFEEHWEKSTIFLF